MYKNKCTKCYDSYYLDKNSFICQKCNDNCATCVDDSIKCTSCKNDSFLDENNNKCIEKCDHSTCESCNETDGATYPSNCTKCKYSNMFIAENGASCLNCSENCLTCSKGPMGDNSNCDTCDPNKFNYKIDNPDKSNCVKECPENEKCIKINDNTDIKDITMFQIKYDELLKV